MFTFLQKRIDTNVKQTNELQNKNATRRSTIDELKGFNDISKQTPPTGLCRVTPITLINLFSTTILPSWNQLTKQQGRCPIQKWKKEPYNGRKNLARAEARSKEKPKKPKGPEPNRTVNYIMGGSNVSGTGYA